MTKTLLTELPIALFAIVVGLQPAAAETSATNTTATAQASLAGFSIDQVPISNAPLGKFPFFGLPLGYVPQNTPKPPQPGHFLFWTGTALRDVEGESYLVTIIGQPNVKQFSLYEIKKNMEGLFKQAGAVKISDAKIPDVALKTIPDDVRMDLLMGLGDVWNNPAQTWVIHRPNEEIWIHFTADTSEASLAVVQTKPFVQTAALLPADQLKSDLDHNGKAVLHVNFAPDKTQILPTSKAQMDNVFALLKADPSLKLAINGYTDDTGTDAHNVALSDGRAKAVQAALVAAGIKADRLQAKGFGRMSPVSDNEDETGKAANRRVELVKLP